MSASLIVLIPVILLGIVGLLCFAGCGYDYSGYRAAAYTSETILATGSIIAYWPLKEAKDTEPAVELISKSNGSYIDPKTVEVDTLYPWPEYKIPDGSNPDVLSAAAPDDIKITLGQPSIVVGDVALLPGDPVPPACVVVNGAYVDVPWNDKFIPKKSFTVEAWVRVDWTKTAPHAFRFVLDMREFNPTTAGFALCAKAVDDQDGVYAWRGIVGDGSTAFVILDSIEAPFKLKSPIEAEGTTHYLALTYDADSKTLTLFVNGVQNVQASSVGYAPNMTQPLWIGAGAPYITPRTQPTDPMNPTSPLFPFVGAIQDVAIYNAALDATTILQHFNDGSLKLDA